MDGFNETFKRMREEKEREKKDKQYMEELERRRRLRFLAKGPQTGEVYIGELEYTPFEEMTEEQKKRERRRLMEEAEEREGRRWIEEAEERERRRVELLQELRTQVPAPTKAPSLAQLCKFGSSSKKKRKKSKRREKESELEERVRLNREIEEDIEQAEEEYNQDPEEFERKAKEAEDYLASRRKDEKDEEAEGELLYFFPSDE